MSIKCVCEDSNSLDLQKKQQNSLLNSALCLPSLAVTLFGKEGAIYTHRPIICYYLPYSLGQDIVNMIFCTVLHCLLLLFDFNDLCR